jgi:hypothetical protein
METRSGYVFVDEKLTKKWARSLDMDDRVMMPKIPP